MAIQLDKLPQEKPEGLSTTLVSEGYHQALIESCEIKPNKTGGEYLAVKLKTDEGDVYANISLTSDKPAVQYQLARFIGALNLPLTGQLDATDLAKLSVGKRIIADIKNEEQKYTNNQGQEVTTTKSVVEVFKHDVFYPISEWARLTETGEAQQAEPADTTADDVPFTVGEAPVPSGSY